MLDSGNFSDNPTPKGELKTKTLLEGMQRLGYAAANVGERDIKMGYDHFAKRTGDVDLPFISANIVRQDTQEPVFRPHVVVEAVSADSQQRVKIGVIGVARFNPVFLKSGPDGTSMVIVHPVEPVKREVERLREQDVDYVVLLAALHKDDARRIIRDVPGLDFVIGSYGGAITSIAEKEADTWILYSGNQGKRIGETRIFVGQDDEIVYQATFMHFLTREFPAIEEMQQFVDTSRAGGTVRQTSGLQRGATSPYSGEESCKSCHEDTYAQWQSTAHAHALTTLREQNKQDDAACRSCHVPGGAEAGLADVGCESCHGPGREHLSNQVASYGAVNLETCTGCHDVKNSPDFDYYSYLPRVAHGRRAAR